MAKSLSDQIRSARKWRTISKIAAVLFAFFLGVDIAQGKIGDAFFEGSVLVIQILAVIYWTLEIKRLEKML